MTVGRRGAESPEIFSTPGSLKLRSLKGQNPEIKQDGELVGVLVFYFCLAGVLALGLSLTIL